MTRFPLTRRDFLNGFALPVAAGVAAGVTGAGANRALGAIDDRGPDADYPPALTGLRGSHPGSFEVAHALAREGKRWPRPERRTDEPYDLVVVGGGISGLTSAWLFRQQVGPDVRILILDNHDDFGGHAKRNEMEIDGQKLIGYGGSQSLEAPASYSPVARRVIKELGVEVERFYDFYDTGFPARHHLDRGILFHGAPFANDRLTADAAAGTTSEERRKRVEGYPLAAATRDAFFKLYDGALADTPEVRAHLAAPDKVAFEEFLRLAVGMPDEGFAVLRDIAMTYWGFGTDALSLAEMLDYPALGDGLVRGSAVLKTAALETAALDAPVEQKPLYPEEPYIFHFPDGNASVARLLVRSLIPGSVPGRNMTDVVQARLRYDLLDRPENGTRIRRRSTAVSVANVGHGAEVVYVQGGRTERVEARHVILACWNNIIPHLCPEIGDAQRTALQYPEKIPLAVVNVGVRNWRPIAASGFGEVYTPNGFLNRAGLDFPVSMGGYEYTRDPDHPAILDCWHAAALRDTTLEPRERLRLGRHRMLGMSFADYEAEVRAQLTAMWGAHGFDPDRDIAAITVNRWPHGYAWEYTDRWDAPEWSRGAGPHVIGRQQIGRISIANSDSEAFAFVNGAIDAAYRAVREQTALSD